MVVRRLGDFKTKIDFQGEIWTKISKKLFLLSERADFDSDWLKVQN